MDQQIEVVDADAIQFGRGHLSSLDCEDYYEDGHEDAYRAQGYAQGYGEGYCNDGINATAYTNTTRTNTASTGVGDGGEEEDGGGDGDAEGGRIDKSAGKGEIGRIRKKKIIGEEELDSLSPHHPTLPPPPPPLPPLPPTITLKFLILGSPRSGKTSLIRRYTSRSFSSIYETTVGADYTKRDVTIKYGEGIVSVRCQIWDIAGQDRFAHLTRAYFNRADGVAIVCDVTRRETVRQVTEWKSEVDRCLGSAVPVMLLCNKSDLPTSRKESRLETGAMIQRVCRENGISRWFETSAKEGGGVDDGFNWVVRECLKREELVEMKKRRVTEDGKKRGRKEEGIKLVQDGHAPTSQGSWAQICTVM